MKKVYMKPLTELTACIQIAALMEGSNFYHGEAKNGAWGGGGGHTVITNGHYDNGNNSSSNNLWED